MSAPEVDKRLELIAALDDAGRRMLLVYFCSRAPRVVDEWFGDREADSSGRRYDAWGHVVIPPGAPVVDEGAAARQDQAHG